MRWIVLRRAAISCLLLALALSAPARTRPHYGGTLRVEIEADAWQKNGMQNGRLGSPLARRLVFDGLTRVNADGEAQPALAVRWSTENSDHRWQFWIRPGIHFQDGTLLTASGVVASLTGSCGAGCPWTAVRAVGSTVVLTSDSAMPNLPTLLAGDDFLIVRLASAP